MTLTTGYYYWLYLSGEWRIGRYGGGFWVDATEVFIPISETDSDSIKLEAVGPCIGRGPREGVQEEIAALKKAWGEGFHHLDVGGDLIAAVEDLIDED